MSQRDEEPLLQFFAFDHLPDELKQISMKFMPIAVWMVDHLPRNAERTTAIRKLLEAKDCAVRAYVWK